MTIFYFTSTGNCLAVAKKIGGNLISIPQVIEADNLHFDDDVIGLIFPIYGFGMPKMVREFIEKASWKADYSFAVGTYGNLPGAAMMEVQKYAKEHGKSFDYTKSLLMVDNYLPSFEINRQIAKLPDKKVDENLAEIITDIENRKQHNELKGLGWRAATAVLKSAEKVFVNGTQAQKYIVNEDCNLCGTCAKVCPAKNIEVSGGVKFSSNCEGCLGCVHLCPKNAIHLKSERSAVRWRNPEVKLSEIIAANNR